MNLGPGFDNGKICLYVLLLIHVQVCSSVDNQLMVYPASQRGAILLKVIYMYICTCNVHVRIHVHCTFMQCTQQV